MVVVSYSGREINAKIVYYGPGLSGKTTNLEKIYDSVPETNRGRMVSMKTQTDRTLFFDLLPLDLGDLQGMKTRLLLYTVPGQVYYNATRKLVLKGVDAVVFVADSAADKMAENRESFSNLEMNLKAYGIDIQSIPLVIQYNKRDLPNATSIDELNRELNRLDVPVFEAEAANGKGVFETLRGVSKLLLAKISKDVLEKDKGAVSGMKRPRITAQIATPAPERPAEPEGTGGKLLKFLKRGKGAKTEESVVESAPRAEPEAPMLSDDSLLEEEVAAPTPERMSAEEELILTEEDLVDTSAGRLPSSAAPASGSADEDPFGDFEREPGVMASKESVASARRAAVALEGTGNGQRISIPLDLGVLPRSGRVTLTFEISVHVEGAETPSAKPSLDADRPRGAGFEPSFSREMEIID